MPCTLLHGLSRHNIAACLSGLLVIELDSVDAHVLLGGGYVLFLYHVEHIAVYVLDRQQVKVLPLVVFHEVAEIDFIGFYGGKAVPLLFQQFEVASRQYVFPFRFGMPHVNPAVINIGVGRIAVIEIRQFKSGGRYVAELLPVFSTSVSWASSRATA